MLKEGKNCGNGAWTFIEKTESASFSRRREERKDSGTVKDRK